MKDIILFDLGNTLVRYYERDDFPDILHQAIKEVWNFLAKKGLLGVSPEQMWAGVKEENHEEKDYSIRNLEDRLIRIFQLDNTSLPPQIMDNMCRCFMKPIFAIAKVYDDVLPVLCELEKRNISQVIVSNTPWGSPANLWREELKRLGLADHIEAAFFCRDAGWRKPARQIFDFVLEKLRAEPQDCLFVGDDPRWDLAGPKTVGMDAIIINREGKMQNMDGKTVKSLYEILCY